MGTRCQREWSKLQWNSRSNKFFPKLNLFLRYPTCFPLQRFTKKKSLSPNLSSQELLHTNCKNLKDFVTPSLSLSSWGTGRTGIILVSNSRISFSFPKHKHPAAVKMAPDQVLTLPVLQSCCSRPSASPCPAAAHHRVLSRQGRGWLTCCPCVWASSQEIALYKLATDPPFMSKHGGEWGNFLS